MNSPVNLIISVHGITIQKPQPSTKKIGKIETEENFVDWPTSSQQPKLQRPVATAVLDDGRRNPKIDGKLSFKRKLFFSGKMREKKQQISEFPVWKTRSQK